LLAPRAHGEDEVGVVCGRQAVDLKIVILVRRMK
jgi:hypothetical protein